MSTIIGAFLLIVSFVGLFLYTAQEIGTKRAIFLYIIAIMASIVVGTFTIQMIYG